MHVELRQQPFDPWAEVRAYRDRSGLGDGSAGASAVFVGTMRDFNEGDRVTGMVLEHYPGMTEREIERIVAEAGEQWPLLDVMVLHRVGAVAPGDDIVSVAVWSAHRAEAFDACRTIMEALKSRAPFWKKETLDDRERWVERNTAGTVETE
jgi:molybdopterin synthase catalytic subunit